MSVEFTCGEPAALAGYLYDECDAAERAAVDAHLAVCPSCREELAALGATRSALASWRPPDAALGFRITSPHDEGDREAALTNVVRPAQWWRRPMPAWAQAAAAILIFAGGAVLGMRAADLAPAAPTVATGASATSNSSTASVSARDLAALEQRLRTEMSALRTATAATPGPQIPSHEAAVLQRVRALLAESEERQQRELAFRLTQVMRDVDSQRRMDLSRIEQTFGQMEGFTRPELADQRQMINYLIQRTGARAPQ
jgi:anti-sigma factor RsiW